MKILALSFLAILFVSCKEPHEDSNQVFMVNNSNQKVVFLPSASYPDTLNFNISGCSTKDIAKIVGPQEMKPYTVGGTTHVLWEDHLAEFPMGISMYFVYNADSAVAIGDVYRGCDELEKRKDLILKRFDVNIGYLINNNYKLVYP